MGLGKTHFLPSLGHYIQARNILQEPEPASDLLQRLRDAAPSEDEALPDLLNDILRLGEGLQARHELQAWLSDNAGRWLQEGRLALAAILEAAARLSIPGLDGVFLEVLRSNDAPALVASVAAQRVRVVPMRESLRESLWDALRVRIEGWEIKPSGQEYTTLALPSVPYVAGERAVHWLVRRLSTGSTKVAQAVALGLLDWATGAIPQSGPMNASTSRLVTDAALKRSEIADPDLLAKLTVLLASVVDDERLDEVARLAVKCFLHPERLEDAAALRAGRLLARRWQRTAMEALETAFEKEHPDSGGFLRYVALLAMASVS